MSKAKKTEETREQPMQKGARTVRIASLVPWSIVLALIIAAAAFIAGWFAHLDYDAAVNAEAARVVQERTALKQ